MLAHAIIAQRITDYVNPSDTKVYGVDEFTTDAFLISSPTGQYKRLTSVAKISQS